MLKDFYDESKPLVTFEAFYGKRRNIVDKCIVIFSKEIYDYMLEKYECEEITRIGACNGSTPVMTFIYKGEKIAFYLSAIGASIAGSFLAEASHLTGATKFVMFGSCGSLDYEKTKGKFIVPTESYRGEGTSYYYKPESEYIEIKNASRVAEIFDEFKIPYVLGRVWTTDSMLRETINLCNKRKEEGCIAVEMELSGVEALCEYYGYELYDFLVSGDVLMEDDYDINELSSANHDVDKLNVALKIIERI